MRRYWIEKELSKLEQIEISGELFHHICSVCRQSLGDRFELIDPSGCAFLAEILDRQKKLAILKLISSRELPQSPRPYLNLCISLPKFNRFEEILEKSVELGIKKVIPFTSDFSFIQNAEKVSESKRLRWKKIVQSATQQSGRGDWLQIDEVTSIEEVLRVFNLKTNVAGLFSYEGECKKTLNQAVLEIKNKKLEEVWFFIGSEGGFSQREVELFQEFDLDALSLGEQVLRVETACLAVASILKYELHLSGAN